MFGDIGWAELLLIGIVALIIIGPEDLPQMFRQVGRFTAKMRAMSRDFSRAMDQAARESGVKDVTDTVKGATSATSMGLNKVKAAADRFEKWDPIKSTTAPVATKPIVQAPMVGPGGMAVTEPAIHGAETQALLKTQTAKQAAALKTAQTPDPAPAAPAVKVKPATPAKPAKPTAPAKPTTPATAAKSAASAAVSKPRAARKPKKADEA